MAQFFGLMPLNAANFESGAAEAGQVLTADGAGGAAWQAAAGGAAGATDITYADLVSAINGASLTPGGFYRITDFATRHYIAIGYLQFTSGDGVVTGPNEPLVVQAIAPDKLGLLAWSALYPQDIIYYDWNPANWLWDYSFGAGNGTDIIPDWKGVIYFRHDTVLDTYAPGDWRHCKTRRWKPNPVAWDAGTAYAANAVVGYSNCAYKALRASTGTQPLAGGDNDTWVLMRDYRTRMYQNAHPTSEHGVPSGPEYADYTLFVDGTPRMVHIGRIVDNSDLYLLEGTSLPGSVFFQTDYTFNCEFDSGFVLNTFNGFVSNSQFGPLMRSNHFIGQVSSSSAGGDFKSNTIGGNFQRVSTGHNFSNNIIGEYFAYNTVETSFLDNVIGKDALYNEIGNGCFGNRIGPNFKNNAIGSFNFYNIIGANFKDHRVTANALVSQDLTSATHVYNKPCEIFKRSDGSVRLRYTDNTDTVVYAAVTD